MKEIRRKDGQAGRGGKVRQLVRLNSKITRLSSELETLQFMQDRLERELAPSDGGRRGIGSRRSLRRGFLGERHE